MEVEAQKRQDDLEKCTVEQDRELLQMETVNWLIEELERFWLDVGDMLLAEHSTDNLKNLINASPFFRNLMMSKRVLFLFPEVLKIIGTSLVNAERVSEEEKSSILSCRLVCRSWNKSVDHYINAVKPDFFQAAPPQPRDPALINARYKYFGFMAPLRLQQFLDYFEESHQQSSPGPQRNPFIGTTVALCNDLQSTEYTRFSLSYQHWYNVLTLLRKYGHHVRVMSLGVLPGFTLTDKTDDFREYFWLKECLEFTPNLTHLKVKQRPVNMDPAMQGNEKQEMDPYFGEHAYRTVGISEYLQRRIFNEMGSLPAEVQERIHANMMIFLQFMLARIPAEQREEQNYDLDEQLAEAAVQTGFLSGLWMIYAQEDQRKPEHKNVPVAANLNENDYWTALAANPLPVLKNLECLKLRKLYPSLFNPLIQSNRHVTWLHIEPPKPCQCNWLPRYTDWWALDFPNLKKLYIKFPGGPGEVRRLRSVDSSFLSLSTLQFVYTAREYMGWTEIFDILEQNWGSTLTELKILLPIPRSAEDKENEKNAFEHGVLALPKLKRLVMWKMNIREHENVATNLPFLSAIEENLEEFVVL